MVQPEPTPATTPPSAENSSGGGRGQKLILAAMIFAVGMTFIDQTIVSIAVPEIQKDLGLSPTGVQWIVNAYLLTLAAFFAFGGRISDILGHRKLVIVGVLVFTFGSVMNGLTPTGDAAEAWFIVFRAVQGFGAALMLPAALAIVVGSYALRERGKALAIFFAITGGLTAIGPIAGGYLSEWTWRAIFWVNVPIAIIALVLVMKAKIVEERHPAPMDYPGLVLIVGGMGLSVLGFQQASVWGWSSTKTWGCIGVGVALLVVFAFVEARTASPLIRVSIFTNRAFTVENLVLFFSMVAFIPVFFFASMYAQIGLGESVSDAGLYLLTFFAGFAVSSQFGGRMLDRSGAKAPVVLGCAVAAVGFALWGNSLTDLDFNNQWYWIVLTGAGMGLMLGPANTDAINRAPRVSYGEVSGVTQTVRNFGASLGMAVLGTILISQNTSNVEETLAKFGVPVAKADEIAHSITGSGGGGASKSFTSQAGAKSAEIFKAVQGDFGASVRIVFFVMAGAMALAAVVALVGLRHGRQEALVDDPSPAAA
jgi:EmrB/QacA subfamily drug resistance transporter